MKRPLNHILGSVALLACAFTIASCASTGASSTEPLLSAAGFVSRTPENSRQQDLYNQLPPYQLHRATYQGQIIYAYKDEKKGLAYVGNEAACQRYQQLATQQRIADDYRTAAEMNRDAAYGWYGAYGPYVGYRPVVIHRR